MSATDNSAESWKKFINTLKLSAAAAAPHITAAGAVTGTTVDYGFVNLGSLQAFVGGISSQHRQDVLNSTLLAQLAADANFNRQTQIDDWYNEYVGILSRVGWSISPFSFVPHIRSAKPTTLAQLTPTVLATLLTPAGFNTLTATVNKIGSLGSADARVKLFETSAAAGKTGNFQTSVISPDASNNDVMAIGAWHYASSTPGSDFLNFDVNSPNVNLFYSIQLARLDESVYSMVRAAIVSKLGAKVRSSIANLDI